jgi:hypothetical protein
MNDSQLGGIHEDLVRHLLPSRSSGRVLLGISPFCVRSSLPVSIHVHSCFLPLDRGEELGENSHSTSLENVSIPVETHIANGILLNLVSGCKAQSDSNTMLGCNNK